MIQNVFLIFLCSSILWAQSANEKKALHLLNRMSFGPTQAEMDWILSKGAKGPEIWFNEQLFPDKIQEPELATKLAHLKTLNLTNEELLLRYPKMKKKKEKGASKKRKKKNVDGMMEESGLVEGHVKDILHELTQQKIIRAIESRKQFQEVLVDFWFNHFNVAFKKGNVKYYISSYEKEAIRPFVFGKFKDMLMATAKSPAMMFYLDNFRSSQEMHNKETGKNVGLNENYARELLELHTLGVDGGYTQKDVQETAKILTGWSIDQPKRTARFVFREKRHVSGPKQVMDFRINSDQGIREGEQLIEYLSKHPSTAKNLAKKLAIKFISDNPSPAVVNQIAESFQKADGDLREVYKKIFSLKEFWADETYKSKIKTPFEYFAFVGRTLGVRFQTTQDREIKKFFQYFEQSGQPLYNCQPPTGFKMTSSAWVSAGALVARINLALLMTQNNSPVFDYPVEKWEKTLEAKNYKNSLEVLKEINANFLYNQVGNETLQKISNQFNEVELLTENHVRPEHSIHYFPYKKMVGLLLSTPELQRR